MSEGERGEAYTQPYSQDGSQYYEHAQWYDDRGDYRQDKRYHPGLVVPPGD